MIPHVAFFFLNARPPFSSPLLLSSPLAHASDSRLTRWLGPSRPRVPSLLITAAWTRCGCILSPCCALWRCCSAAQAAGRGPGGYGGQTCSRGLRTPSDRAYLGIRATGQRGQHVGFDGGGGGAQAPRMQPGVVGCMRGGRLQKGRHATELERLCSLRAGAVGLGCKSNVHSLAALLGGWVGWSIASTM